jgi:EDD domain protein, degV family
MVGGNMYINLYVSICALLISFFLLINFFSKKRYDNEETKIFSYMLIFNFINTIFTLGIVFIEKTNIINIIFLKILNKLNNVIQLGWIWLLFLYMLYMLCNNKEKKYNLIKIITVIINILLGILIFILPTSFYNNIYLNGLSETFSYIIYFVCLLVIIILTIKNIKNMSNKKNIIVFTISLLLMLTALIIKKINPELLIISSIFTYINLIINSTEDPDSRLLLELQKEKEKNEKLNNIKIDFLTNMNYEFRTSLNTIVGFSECIKQEDSIDACKNDADDIITSSQNLLEIINDVLDISKLETNNMKITEEDYKPLEIFENVISSLKPKLSEKEIEIKTNFNENIPYMLFGDSNKVKQIITNILMNSIKHTEDGSINFEVNCTSEKDKCNLVISIENTGKTIKKENKSSNNLKEFNKNIVEQSELEFLIAKKFVDMLGGKIVLDEKNINKTKVTIYLNQKIKMQGVPLIAEISKLEESIKPQQEDYSDKKVLIVDDNKMNLKVATRLLKNYNIITTEVLNGYEAINKIKNNEKYDLIFLDDIMPKKNGKETLNELKKIKGFDIPVIVLTANVLEGMKEKYIEEGFDDYLAKPINKEELKKILNKFLIDRKSDIEDTILFSPNSKFEQLSKELLEEVELVNDIEIDNDIEQIEEKIEEKKQLNYKNKKFLIENNIDVDAAEKLLGEMSTYDDALDDFIKEADSKYNLLQGYMKIDKLEKCYNIFRTIKTDTRYLGFIELNSIFSNLEKAIKENDIDYVKNNIKTSLKVFKKYIEISKEYLGK